MIEAKCSLLPFSKASSLSEKAPYFDLNIKEFPIAFFANFSSKSANITNFLGNSFDCKISKENKTLFAQVNTPFLIFKNRRFKLVRKLS